MPGTFFVYRPLGWDLANKKLIFVLWILPLYLEILSLSIPLYLYHSFCLAVTASLSEIISLSVFLNELTISLSLSLSIKEIQSLSLNILSLLIFLCLYLKEFSQSDCYCFSISLLLYSKFLYIFSFSFSF